MWTVAKEEKREVESTELVNLTEYPYVFSCEQLSGPSWRIPDIRKATCTSVGLTFAHEGIKYYAITEKFHEEEGSLYKDTGQTTRWENWVVGILTAKLMEERTLRVRKTMEGTEYHASSSWRPSLSLTGRAPGLPTETSR